MFEKISNQNVDLLLMYRLEVLASVRINDWRTLPTKKSEKNVRLKITAHKKGFLQDH